MFAIMWTFFLYLPVTYTIECYTGSQLQVQNCPSVSCVKQVFGMDTVRYCDGSGVQSVCQAYKITDSCDTVPNVGYICCCSGNLCNHSITLKQHSPFILIFSLWRIF